MGLRQIYAITLMLYLTTCIVMPSGSVYGIPIKLALMALLLLLLPLCVPARSVTKTSVTTVSSLFLLLCGAGLIGIFKGADFASLVDEGVAIVSVAATLGVILTAVRAGAMTSGALVDFILKITALYMVVRLIVEGLVMNGVIGIWQFSTVIETVFGASLITYPLDGGLIRLNLTNDWIFLPVLPALWLVVRWSIPVKLMYTVALLINIYLSYSRLLWIGLVVVAAAAILNALFTSRKSLAKSLLPAPFLLAVLIVMGALGSFNSAGVAIQQRFTGVAANQSDAERDKMQHELSDFFELSPVLGNGLGSHPERYVRFKQSPWLYELQWLALAGQFGVLGTFALVTLLLRALLPAVLQAKSSTRNLLLMLLIFWLATGTVNCFLVTSVSGVIFAMFPLIGGSEGAPSLVNQRRKNTRELAVRYRRVLSKST